MSEPSSSTPQPPNPNNLYPIFPWMWSSPIPNPPNANKPEDDDSWEVRAFAEDTSSVAGTTWPPRSYTCTFCRREFRSAQALGGHMNVHRRDRARLQIAPPPQVLISPAPVGSCNYNSSPMQLGFFENRTGFCLVCHQLGSPCNGVLVGAEPPVHEAEVPYLEKEELGIDNSGEEDDKKDTQIREVEVDLELRLGN